jgi:putative intracellular protease/amidase
MRNPFFSILFLILVINPQLNAQSPPKAILLAVTNRDHMNTPSEKTGAYLSEITHAYAVFKAAGYRVDFVSAQGGTVPLDGVDVIDELNTAFLTDSNLKACLQKSLPAISVNPTHYQAIYFAGGHGVMWDFPEDPGLMRLSTSIYAAGGVIGAVCHGPAALVNLKIGGEYLVYGKRVSCFTNEEEAFIKRTHQVPFALETRLLERGAIITKAHLLKRHVEVSERLVTGQNPASAKRVAEAMVYLLGQ